MKEKNTKYDHLMKQGYGVLVSAYAVMASAIGIDEAMLKITQEIREMIQFQGARQYALRPFLLAVLRSVG